MPSRPDSLRSRPRARRFLRTLAAGAAAAGLAGCSRFEVLNTLVGPGRYERTADVAYGPLPRQTLDVYRPSGRGEPAGVVVFIYGGSWNSGSKDDYRFVAEALTSRGFVAVLPDYRVYPDVMFPTFVEDAALAVKWAHEHSHRIGGDGKGVFLLGHSAGAHIALLVTLDESYLRELGVPPGIIRATAGIAGAYDFEAPADLRVVFGLAGGEAMPAASQPINFVDGSEPPILLVHGLADTTVDPLNTLALTRRLAAEGGEVFTAWYPDEGHVSIVLALARPFRWLAPTLQDVTAFYRAVMDAPPAAGKVGR